MPTRTGLAVRHKTRVPRHQTKAETSRNFEGALRILRLSRSDRWIGTLPNFVAGAKPDGLRWSGMTFSNVFETTTQYESSQVGPIPSKLLMCPKPGP
jgi:hypothetical protein